jgi:NAD(P)-dependent dehydrogenase (short-subunit alcohol dehydrogenase family)
VVARSSACSGRPGRLAFSTSEAHAWVDLKGGVHPDIFAHESNPDQFRIGRAYHVSKLLLTFWSRELASRVDQSTVLVGDISPGFCASGLFRGAPAQAWLGKIATWMSSRSPEVAAIMYILGIFLSSKEEFHGGYFVWGKPTACVIDRPIIPYPFSHV